MVYFGFLFIIYSLTIFSEDSLILKGSSLFVSRSLEREREEESLEELSRRLRFGLWEGDPSRF